MESLDKAQGKSMVPAGLKLLGLERMASGVFVLLVGVKGAVASEALVANIALNASGKVLLMVGGTATVIFGLGLWKRMRWARVIVLVQAAVGFAVGIIAVTYVALSWPQGWGRVAIALFFLGVLCFFVALVGLFIALTQAGEFFRRVERTSVVKRWSRTMWGAVVVLIVLRIFAVLAFDINLEHTRVVDRSRPVTTIASPDTVQGSITYCETIEGARERAQCLVQVAIAAAAGN